MGGRGILARIGRIQPVDVGQQDQRLGAHQLRGARRQAVIVAVADLFGDHRVVLVDDRHAAQGKQGLDGGARVQPASALFGVLARQQHLGGLQPHRREGLVPGGHQARLAGGGGGLFLVQFQTLAGQAEVTAAQRPGARRHHHDGAAFRHQGGDVARQPFQPGGIGRAAGRVDDQGRAHLDGDASRVAQGFGQQGFFGGGRHRALFRHGVR